MDVGKISAIRDRKEPQNVKQLQEFLGCSNYYRSWIKDYAKITKPLFDLLKKDTKFKWKVIQWFKWSNYKHRFLQKYL